MMPLYNFLVIYDIMINIEKIKNMAFPSNPSAGDTHTENGVEYKSSDYDDPTKNYWKRNKKSLYEAFEQALLDIEELKTKVAALEGS